MDFALKHSKVDGTAVKSNIRIMPTTGDGSLDDKVLNAANQAARDLFSTESDKCANANLFKERVLPTKSIIEPGALIVIFESFDNLTFTYAKSGEIFQNRNGRFPHDDFIGKPFGSVVRSANNKGYGFVYLLKPTPELWARSLPHRTQIIHELDASMICHYLELRPNMVVCESGTGSGAMSHAILRSIAPQGKLYTYEFNEQRADKAREEFKNNGVSHMVDVFHHDVCGKDGNGGGFNVRHHQAHAVMLDLPEPWFAVPHAAKVLKKGGRIASYSPCVEQAQKCISAMKEMSFHTIKTFEFRLREYYVDETELSSPPKEKRPRLEQNEMHHMAYVTSKNSTEKEENKLHEEDKMSTADTSDQEEKGHTEKGNNMVCTRPFTNMRGHTAFLTFATAGNKSLNGKECVRSEGGESSGQNVC
mmetsp:Transcript_7903/g.12089  ORF Transcript_7903/g.12089 Transcript_7903/m.12089 type:complete len:419 (-) Transcript_7903:898-2154(-)|eukprot:CAMPEP_0178911750 /NCGR_PEP_ID=MMETSP0786-20121207/9874_1 /TAXON_ID=186022 /ORGANISM="Thalassionema frauenfeldii, Strain CCMP 1798" /LENGTH=418 /DNA_ID=CAMNT_0020584243 /DNA_START=64 /DNA_END=1320 /DNA_ORIENTATION=-